MNVLTFKNPFNNGEIEFQMAVERDDIVSSDGIPLYKGTLTIIDKDKKIQPTIQALGDITKHLVDRTSMNAYVCISQDKLTDAEYIVRHFLVKMNQ